MPSHRVRALAAALPGLPLVLGLPACAPAAIDGGFDSGNPAAKLYAIEHAAGRGDRSPATLRHIVDELDSDDPAVRMIAIAALQRLTGETKGYRYDDPRPDRAEAIGRWSEYLAGAPAGGDLP